MFLHSSVLLDEVEQVFVSLSHTPHCVIDATLGLGGHTRMLLRHMQEGSILLGLDRDRQNLSDAQDGLLGVHSLARFIPVHTSFEDISEILTQYSQTSIDFILYDLGVSSAHYDDASRGFSLRYDGPLDMRFDRSQGITAEEIVMTYPERELFQLFLRYADEKKAIFIARAICEMRKAERIDTTYKLLRIIESASFDKKSPMRVFQALRIAVNDEFGHIERSMREALQYLTPGGRIAVITFHSIEDRLVKNIFSEYTQDVIDDFTGHIRIPAAFQKYNKKPIEPTEQEIHENPRSRSAKMRVLEKIGMMP